MCVCVAGAARQQRRTLYDGCACAVKNWRAQWGDQICLECREMKMLRVKLIFLNITTACHMTFHDYFTSTQTDNLLVTYIVLLNIISCKVLLEALEGVVTWYKMLFMISWQLNRLFITRRVEEGQRKVNICCYITMFHMLFISAICHTLQTDDCWALKSNNGNITKRYVNFCSVSGLIINISNAINLKVLNTVWSLAEEYYSIKH